jgi:beta-aspartyl-peptidase (threonine type)
MNRRLLLSLLLLLFPVLLLAQQNNDKADVVLRRDDAPAAKWAIAIHGGAGTIPKNLPEAQKQQYLHSLGEALKIGQGVLRQGGTSLDAVEKVIRFLEDDPLFNAGKGAVYTHERTHELDAAIMDGSDLSCGSVAALKTVKNPISLARLVKERSPHVFLVGEGAEAFATEMKVERVPNSYFDTPKRLQDLEEALKEEPKEHGTVGCVALDVHGNLAAGTSTGGLTNKRFGRLGDVPVIGAGTYANNKTCAISATGTGEEFIKHTVAHDISALMEYGGLSLQQAADRVIHQKLKAGDGGVIGVGRDGSIALVFNSEGMYRGAADSGGRFEVRIWE